MARRLVSSDVSASGLSSGRSPVVSGGSPRRGEEEGGEWSNAAHVPYLVTPRHLPRDVERLARSLLPPDFSSHNNNMQAGTAGCPLGTGCRSGLAPG